MNMSIVEAAGLLGDTFVSQEQETEAIIHTVSPKLTNSRVAKGSLVS